MPIRYSILENPLQQGSFYARTEKGEKIDLHKISQLIAARAPYSENTVKSVLNHLIDVTVEIIQQGNTPVIDDFVYFSTSLQGKLLSPDMVITPANAELQIHVNDTQSLRERVQHQVQFSKITTRFKAPLVNSVFDHASGFYNVITRGGILHLEGDNLKLNPNQPDAGVFLSKGLTETRLNIYAQTANKNIDVAIPADYVISENQPITVIVRTRYTQTGELREGKAHHHCQMVHNVHSFPVDLFKAKMSLIATHGYQVGEHLRLNIKLTQDQKLRLSLTDQGGTGEAIECPEDTPFIVTSVNPNRQVELKVPNRLKLAARGEVQAVIKIAAESTTSIL